MLPRYCGRLFEKGDCIMKKFLTLLLALAMTLSLAACGSDSTEETEGTDGTEAETVDYTAMSDDELKGRHHHGVRGHSHRGHQPRLRPL